MDESPKPSENPIDLSSLEGLTLGTAWSPSQVSPRGPQREDRPPHRSFAPRGPRPEGLRAPRRDDRRSDSPRWSSERAARPAPIIPPSVKVVFYPEEAPFKALTKAIKASKRTYELFEIARLMLEKPERAAATLTGLPSSAEDKSPMLYQCVADSSVWANHAEALAHAASLSLEKFYQVEEVQVDAPKGNFVVIHKCGITGQLIAPPNYHRYGQLLAEHCARHLPHMSPAAVQAKLESVKEPEAIAEWLERMKKVTRYTLLQPVEGQPSSFEGSDAAKAHLVAHHKEALVKAVPQVRLSGKQVESLPSGEIKRSIDVARAQQMKFPLDTANALRGRLRRMGFHIYKRGQKGVSYLSAVKRRFRSEGQMFAPEVQRVIEVIEKHPQLTDADLPKQVLGISVPAAPAEGQPAVSALSSEEDTAVKALRQTLQWLIEQGYVIHFGNGTLFVPPARAANAPKEDEDEEPAAEASTEAAPEAPADAPTEPPQA